jgi:hypothetical protein
MSGDAKMSDTFEKLNLSKRGLPGGEDRSRRNFDHAKGP